MPAKNKNRGMKPRIKAGVNIWPANKGAMPITKKQGRNDLGIKRGTKPQIKADVKNFTNSN